MPTPRRSAAILAVLASTGVLAACGQSAAATGSNAGGPVTLRLGYLPNLTHAIPMVALAEGFYGRDLGAQVTLRTQTFNAGPAAVEAIFGGALDAAYVGPNPAINAFEKTSKQPVVHVVAGAASGGAGLVVRSDAGISDAKDLKGRKLASPQLGNTQDVALRSYLAAHGIKTTPQGGGDVAITSTDNSTILQLLKQGQIDGAWLPEPYLSRAIAEDGARLFVDEASLWPGGQFPTTELIVSTAFAQAHPDVVRNLLRAHVEASDFITGNPAKAQSDVNDALLKLTQKKLSDSVVASAWQRLSFGVDPLATQLARQAAAAHDAGLLSSDDLHGIMDLTVLNSVLKAEGKPGVSNGGYGSP